MTRHSSSNSSQTNDHDRSGEHCVEDPDHNLNITAALALGGVSPTEIAENNERRGTRQSARSETMPTRDLRAYASIPGFRIGEVVADDPMFTYVTLPDGWVKKPSRDHSMYVDIFDDRGRKRGMYFFKNAFYDRRANCWSPERRFYISEDYTHKDMLCVQVTDRGSVEPIVIFATEPVPKPSGAGGHEEYEELERMRVAEYERCITWLVGQGYPDYKNFLAYWDAT